MTTSLSTSRTSFHRRRPFGDQAVPFLEWVEVKRLVVDKSYQRSISRAGAINIQRIADQFEWAKFSPLSLPRSKVACSR